MSDKICLTYLSLLQRLTNSANVFILIGAKMSSIRMEFTILEISVVNYSGCCLISSIYIIRSIDIDGVIKEYVLFLKVNKLSKYIFW